MVNHIGHMRNRLSELKYVPIGISETRKENKLALLLICEKTYSTHGVLCFVASSLDTFGHEKIYVHREDCSILIRKQKYGVSSLDLEKVASGSQEFNYCKVQ